MDTEKRIVIIGGGFGGIRAALDLEKKNLKNTKITLISNKCHFEYYPRIYRVVTGDSPLEVCIRLDDIFKDKNVEIVIDEILNIDSENKKAVGKSGSFYRYDDLILGLGSETTYFGIEGMSDVAFGFKSIQEAIKLKNHLHKMFDVYLSASKEDLIAQLHIVIVGGGPSGVELAGSLLKYMQDLSKKHAIDNTFITIDIIQAASRLVPALPEEVSNRIYKKLHSLGVNIFLNRTVVKDDVDKITMKDMSVRSNTLIWTAGSKVNSFYTKVPKLQLKKNGSVIVDENLKAVDSDNIYVIGDAASTPYAGLAQTAIYDGEYIADLLYRKYKNKKLLKYKPSKVAYAVPVGDKWAAVAIGPLTIYGYAAWILRELIDLRFFMTILPFKKAFSVFRAKPLSDSCNSCNPK